MAFNRGFLNKRVTILTREASFDGTFGRKGGDFIPVKTVWANCTYTKGVKSLREGAIDAYDTYLVRMDYHSAMKRECRISWDDKIYQIISLNENKEANEMQIVCTEIVK